LQAEEFYVVVRQRQGVRVEDIIIEIEEDGSC
jgi:hypothetical protein